MLPLTGPWEPSTEDVDAVASDLVDVLRAAREYAASTDATLIRLLARRALIAAHGRGADVPPADDQKSPEIVATAAAADATAPEPSPAAAPLVSSRWVHDLPRGWPEHDHEFEPIDVCPSTQKPGEWFARCAACGKLGMIEHRLGTERRSADRLRVTRPESPASFT